MANSIRGLAPLPLHMSPVRAPSASKVGDIDRSFLDDLTRAGARHTPSRPETASAASVSAGTARSTSASSEPDIRARLGLRTPPATEDGGDTGARRAIASDGAPAATSTPGRTPALSSSTGPAAVDEDGTVISTGTLSEDPHTAGMYVPPDFYHGNSYSPVFDQQDENGNWVATPRFEGQKIYSKWRGSLPPDFDPNARVIHDPLLDKQGPRWWKQDENGDWVRRPESPEGLALMDDGSTNNTLDPAKYPEKS